MDRLDKLELITKRLMRRAGKKKVALITPYPISNALFGERIEGPILRYMFPCAGVITKGLIRLGQKPKNQVILNIRIFNDLSASVRGFTWDKKMLKVTPNLAVEDGDCLEISLVTGEEIITECWISFLWKPSISDIEAKSYLIEELESDLLPEK